MELKSVFSAPRKKGLNSEIMLIFVLRWKHHLGQLVVKTGTWAWGQSSFFFFSRGTFSWGPVDILQNCEQIFFFQKKKTKWVGYLQQPDHLFNLCGGDFSSGGVHVQPCGHTPGERWPPSIHTRGWGSAVDFRIRSCLASWSNPAWPRCWWRTWCPGRSRWAGASPGSARHWHDQEWAVLCGPSSQPAPAGSWSCPAAEKHNTGTIRHRSRPTAASDKVANIQSDAATFALSFCTISSYSSKLETSSVRGLRYSRGWL